MTSPGPAVEGGLSIKQWNLVTLLFGFSMISYFDRTIMSIAGPQIIRDLGLSPTAMGSVYSAFILGYALFMLPGGHLTDRIGPRRTLMLMGFWSAAFTGLTIAGGKPGLGSWIGVAAAFFVIRFGLGVVTAPLYPACARMAANWIPMVYHARVQAFIIGGSSLGAAISPVLFQFILRRSNWQTPFLVAALATAALAALWFWYASDAPTAAGGIQIERPVRSSPSWAKLFTNSNLMLLTYAYGTLGYFQYVFFYWMYYYFSEVLHLGEAESARYTAFLFLTEGAIMPLGGFASDRLTRLYGPRYGRKSVLIAGLSLGAAFTCAGTASFGLAAVFCLSLGFGLAACCEGPFWATVTEMAGERVGEAAGILNAGAQVGGFFSPVLTPVIASFAGWQWGLYAGCLVALSGVVAVALTQIGPPVAVNEAPALAEN
ncbi:MAG TPA: MFS transporter [Bryobacteraceae bacterium]|nr:MFS transporter [Bryobacteraceae bacterium]